MKTRLLYVLIGAVLATTLTFGAMRLTAQDAAYSGPKWEYLEVEFNVVGDTPTIFNLRMNGVYYKEVRQPMYDFLNSVGGQGYELIQALGEDHYIFKRPAQ